jgi:hypothetical protein
MHPPKDAAILTAALIVLSEAASSHETNQMLAQQPHDHREAVVDMSVTGNILSIVNASGAQHTYAVIKVKGIEPEVFWLAAIRHPEFKHGKFMETSDDLTEAELRTELRKLGCSNNEATFLIAKARTYPS